MYINDKPLTSTEYNITKNAGDSRLTVASPPSGRFTLGVVTKFKPQDNLELSGLYKSSGNFCTQCEAEGFRLITYYPVGGSGGEGGGEPSWGDASVTLFFRASRITCRAKIRKYGRPTKRRRPLRSTRGNHRMYLPTESDAVS